MDEIGNNEPFTFELKSDDIASGECYNLVKKHNNRLLKDKIELTNSNAEKDDIIVKQQDEIEKKQEEINRLKNENEKHIKDKKDIQRAGGYVVGKSNN
ncbi:hypothetical protein [Anaerocolumna sp. MB42-C2]|uniref:hypothetical protein n=1 Tax=Anaerocolumna sp. MB42-C2 TaxID=3070997 RepID=UPI0027DF2621|nr:hypothetical protein [Anaerocolumna sp. MB42-C2]WMJ86775.1 hypothetical protein RBU59_22455 [Anaerocolumna sp. MB42-C2]